MALKPDRNVILDDVSHFMNETATRGCVVVVDTSVGNGSGAAMDQAGAGVKLPDVANGSGEYPVGILMNDVVNNNQTRQHRNFHKDEVQQGGKVWLLKEGWVVTNVIATGATVTRGAAAYFTTDGEIHSTSTNSTQIGSFASVADADGYVKVNVNIR
jgi:hypothetical protein